MLDLKLITADISHVEDILALEIQYPHNIYSKNMILSAIQDEHTINFIAYNNDIVVGYISFSFIIDEGEILKIIVDEKHRKNGIGSWLIEQIKIFANENQIRRIFLEVREDNEPAKNLYEKMGFTKEYSREKYYGDVNADIYGYEV